MKRGFTLMELLVVIAIATILAAIILPILARAKATAKDSASLSQLRQIGMAEFIYCSDHNDTVPYVGHPEIIARLRLGLLDIRDWPGYEGQVTIFEALDPYTKSRSVWKSPADPGELPYVPPLIESMDVSYGGLPHAFCIGPLTALGNPSESALLRELVPFRRGKAYIFRADGSAKLLPWLVGADQIQATQTAFGCD